MHNGFSSVRKDCSYMFINSTKKEDNLVFSIYGYYSVPVFKINPFYIVHVHSKKTVLCRPYLTSSFFCGIHFFAYYVLTL